MSDNTGSVATGAASGAVSGSVAGPWGALAGAVIGGAASYFGGQQNNEANAQQAELNRQFQLMQQQIAMGYNTSQADWAKAENQRSQAQQQDFQKEMMERQFGLNTAGMDMQQAFAREQTNQQEQFQRETMSTAMQYDERMSSTAWQRATADMKAAGINPLLAYSQGGASSPSVSGMSGASGSSAAPTVSAGSGASSTRPAPTVGQAGGAQATMQNVLTPAFASALQGSRIAAELEGLNLGNAERLANIGLTKKKTDLTSAQILSELENPDFRRASTTSEMARAHLINAQTTSTRAQPALIEAQANSANATARQVSRETDRQDRFGSGAVGQSLGALDSAVTDILTRLRNLTR